MLMMAPAADAADRLGPGAMLTPGAYLASGSGQFRCHLQPDGNLVVYYGNEGRWQDIGPGEQPSFSPDGSSIVARTCIGSECGLFIMGRDGGNKRRVTTDADDAMPSWSPTGDRIAYASQKNGN